MKTQKFLFAAFLVAVSMIQGVDASKRSQMTEPSSEKFEMTRASVENYKRQVFEIAKKYKIKEQEDIKNLEKVSDKLLTHYSPARSLEALRSICNKLAGFEDKDKLMGGLRAFAANTVIFPTFVIDNEDENSGMEVSDMFWFMTKLQLEKNDYSCAINGINWRIKNEESYSKFSRGTIVRRLNELYNKVENVWTSFTLLDICANYSSSDRGSFKELVNFIRNRLLQGPEKKLKGDSETIIKDGNEKRLKEFSKRYQISLDELKRLFEIVIEYQELKQFYIANAVESFCKEVEKLRPKENENGEEEEEEEAESTNDREDDDDDEDE